MGGDTTIEWTDKVWNPISGCTKVSPGCDHCYASRMAPRLRGRFGYPEADPFAVTLHRDKLYEPWEWKKPKKVFVCSMSDLFHPRVPFLFALRMFVVMAGAPQHTFQVLTKRPGRMAHFANVLLPQYSQGTIPWPPNVWAGTSVESAKYLPRLDVLARVPAKVRFVSCEPLLGPLDLRPWLDWSRDYDCLDGMDTGELSWVIVGGESGPGARPMHPQWARDIRDQCEEAGVPYFHKQNGEFIEIDGPRCRAITVDKRELDFWMHERGGITPLHEGRRYYSVYGTSIMRKVRKKAAGSLLDGVAHKEMPNG